MVNIQSLWSREVLQIQLFRDKTIFRTTKNVIHKLGFQSVKFTGPSASLW